jgi:type IV pilus assembly protein PilM
VTSFSLTRKVLCLDWDKRSLRVLFARVSGGRLKVEDAHSFRIPVGTDIDDAAVFGAFIARCLADKDIRRRLGHKRVIVDVPRDRAVINRLSLPPTPMAELPSAVRFQAMKELPFPLDEAHVDYTVLERSGSNATEVLLAGVRNDVIQRLKAICTAAGLTLWRVGLRPYANMVVINKQPHLENQRVLFVDVGATMTEIDIFRGGVLAFSRSAGVSVPFVGGELASDDSRISSKAELTAQERTEQLTATALDELLVEITRTLQGYRGIESSAQIDRIVIAGGTGIESVLAPIVEKRFNIATELFDASAGLGLPGSEKVKLRSFAAVLGLAGGLNREGKLDLDFLNPKKPVPKGQSLQRRLRVYGLAAAVVLLAITAAIFNDFRKLDRLISDLEKLAGRTDGSLTRQVKEIIDLDIKRDETQRWAQEAGSIIWLDHLLRLTNSAIDPGKKMLVSDLEFNAKGGFIRMKVAAASLDVVSEFVGQLNAATEEDGKPIYRAQQGVWQDEKKELEGGFKGRVDVTVQLLELNEFRDPAKLKALESKRKQLRQIGA